MIALSLGFQAGEGFPRLRKPAALEAARAVLDVVLTREPLCVRGSEALQPFLRQAARTRRRRTDLSFVADFEELTELPRAVLFIGGGQDGMRDYTAITQRARTHCYPLATTGGAADLLWETIGTELFSDHIQPDEIRRRLRRQVVYRSLILSLLYPGQDSFPDPLPHLPYESPPRVTSQGSREDVKKRRLHPVIPGLALDLAASLRDEKMDQALERSRALGELLSKHHQVGRVMSVTLFGSALTHPGDGPGDTNLLVEADAGNQDLTGRGVALSVRSYGGPDPAVEPPLFWEGLALGSSESAVLDPKAKVPKLREGGASLDFAKLHDEATSEGWLLFCEGVRWEDDPNAPAWVADRARTIAICRAYLDQISLSSFSRVELAEELEVASLRWILQLQRVPRLQLHHMRGFAECLTLLGSPLPGWIGNPLRDVAQSSELPAHVRESAALLLQWGCRSTCPNRP